MVRLVSAVTKTGTESCLQEQVSQVQEQVDRDRQSGLYIVHLLQKHCFWSILMCSV